MRHGREVPGSIPRYTALRNPPSAQPKSYSPGELGRAESRGLGTETLVRTLDEGPR